MLFKKSGTHKGEKGFTWKATQAAACHTDTSSKWAPVQTGHYGAWAKRRGLQRTPENKLILWPLQRKIKGQSWFTQFSATSVEAQMKTKGRKITMSGGINKHERKATAACWEEAAKLILHESLSLGCYTDTVFHFNTLRLNRSFHSQSHRGVRGAAETTCPAAKYYLKANAINDAT